MKPRIAALVLAVALSFGTTGCPKATYKNLATASDTIAHALNNVEDAETVAVTAGVMTQKERADFDVYVIRAATAGQALDAGLRNATQPGATTTQQINAFLDAFQKLNTASMGIRDDKTRLAISTALTSAEGAIAIIVAFIPATPSTPTVTGAK
jgi:hypothetical protein